MRDKTDRCLGDCNFYLVQLKLSTQFFVYMWNVFLFIFSFADECIELLLPMIVDVNFFFFVSQGLCLWINFYCGKYFLFVAFDGFSNSLFLAAHLLLIHYQKIMKP